jgi:hypothetical protein
MAAGRLSVMREGELLATLADVLPVSHGITYLTGPRHTHNRVSVMQVALGRPVFEAEADSLCYSCGELGGGHGIGCPDGPIAPAGAVVELDRPDPWS